MAVPEVPDWTRVVLLSGIDPSGNPITIAVDASGYIVAIMKGEYAGTLKNVAVDSQGRLIMIPTDPLDIWGNAISMGNAELAAVFSPAKRFDRRGNVILVDDFESGLGKCSIVTSGTGAAVTLDSDQADFGRYSVKLLGGSDTLLLAALQYRKGYLKTSRFGFEVTIRPQGSYDYLHFYIFYYDGVNRHEGWLRYDASNNKWQYQNSAAVWTDLLTNVVLYETTSLFHPFKMVIDPSADTYIRALFPDQEVDMDAYALRKVADTTTPHIICEVRVQSTSGSNGRLHVGSVVITQNEPAN